MKEHNRDIELSKMQHESNLRQYDAEHASNLHQYDAECDSNLELFRSVILSGQGALKSVILLNGGASVALLAFVGAIWDKLIDPIVTKKLLISMVLFILGVFFGAVASGLTYLCQLAYGYEKNKIGNILRVVIIILVVVAYVLFIVASSVAVCGFWKRLLSVS